MKKASLSEAFKGRPVGTGRLVPDYFRTVVGNSIM